MAGSNTAEGAAALPTLAAPAPDRLEEWLAYGRRNPNLAAGGVILGAIVAFSLLGPLLIDPAATRTTAFAKDLSPSLEHVLGTDSFGRDVLALIVVGTPQTLKVGLIAGGIALLIGSLLGLVQGYYHGAVGVAVRTVTDVTLTIPALLIL